MTTHFIILSSSYSKGTRIGLHYPFEGKVDIRMIKEAVDKVGGAFDGKTVLFSTHVVQTDSSDWDSVIRKDGYFRTVEIIDDIDVFISIIRESREFKGIDVAAYIASKKPYTHTRLEKLTYYCYSDYLCKTGKRLFTDEIYAFEHGPVVETVFHKLKVVSSTKKGSLIESHYIGSDRETDMDVRSGLDQISVRSKLLFAEDGQEKVASIDGTLAIYDMIDTETLIEMTHGKDTPWSMTKPRTTYKIISDETIRRYHINEIYRG